MTNQNHEQNQEQETVSCSIVDNTQTICIIGDFDYQAVKMLKTVIGSEGISPAGCVIDFSKVTHISSAGIGGLMYVWEIAGRKPGSITIINSNPTINKLLRIAGLDKIFTIAKD